MKKFFFKIALGAIVAFIIFQFVKVEIVEPIKQEVDTTIKSYRSFMDEAFRIQ
jgi:hypothetical protein